ncbi:MAG: DNA polymerase domain-containing protein [Candidatus Pacearchaeota archaeon]|jgi:DNA polymerase elongation subunit (family B)|nr:hypothetical protein [Clostridia bacterium]
MINVEQVEKNLKVSYFDENGDVAFQIIPIEQEDFFEWVPYTVGKAEPSFKSWDGKLVQKKKAFFLNKWRIEEILMKQPDYIKEKIYSKNDPKKFFVDIETEVDDEWPKPSVARHKVTAISFAHDNMLAVLGTKPLLPVQIRNIEIKINKYLTDHNYPEIKFSYVYFKTEYDLLYSFFNKAIQKMPLITGWNFINFDWAYLVNRCRNLSIDPSVAAVNGKLVGREELPMHRVVVDYMELYKKWDRVIFKDNNTLQYVATAALGMGKIPYNGTLQDLYESDFEQYVYYNGVDSILVKLIDAKLSTMSTYLKLGNITKVEANRAFSPIAMAESVMTREFYGRNRIFPTIKNRNVNKTGYEGAFVFPPVKGIYDWVASFDFASLYPSIMRQWNMSPEAFMGKEAKKPDIENITYTASGAYFNDAEDSVFRTILTDFYGQRKSAKKQMFAVQNEIQELKKLKAELEKI